MKIVIFDFDGVIANTFDIAYKIMKDLDYIDISADEFRTYFNGNIYDQEDITEDVRKEDLHEDSPFFEKYVPQILKTVPVKGIDEVIKTLSADYKLVVVSSTISSAIDDFLTKYDLREYFDTIHGADEERSKSVKIDRILSKLNVSKDDAVFITDTLGDIREADKVGVKCIATSWGYSSAKNLKKGDALKIVDEPEEIVDEVLKYFK